MPFLVVSIVDDFEPSDLAAGLVFFVGPWAVGVVTARAASPAREEAVARAEQLERKRELEAARAAAEERTRIARELHDIVSHSISVVTIQTQAVRRRLGPEHAAEAARPRRRRGDRPRGAGRDAPALRGAAHRRASRAVAGAAARALRARTGWSSQVGSGDLQVRLRSRASPSPLSPGVDLAAYRIAQEGLTNAAAPRRRDAAPTCWCATRPARLDVEVEDNGRGLPRRQRPPPTAGTGWSASASGSRCTAARSSSGPSSSGGVRLAASLR